ncbi:MAG: hypothetical protein AB1512_28250 [Thermodesulfobacteriota bacterium]
MNANASTALVPYQGIVMPLLAAQDKNISAFSHRDQPAGGMRFLGYGTSKGSSIYGSTGRMVSEPLENGNSVDIYV